MGSVEIHLECDLPVAICDMQESQNNYFSTAACFPKFTASVVCVGGT